MPLRIIENTSVISIKIKKLKKKNYARYIARVILVQNVGLFWLEQFCGSKIAGDLTETNARVISSVEETSEYKFIREKIFLTLSTVVRKAKIKKAKKELKCCGNYR